MRLPPSDTESDGPNLTPIIDVVFLLLIFFLVATRFDQQEREISTRLAKVAKAQPMSSPPGELVVNINAKGEYVVVGQNVPADQLEPFLSGQVEKNPSTLKVQIRADERVEFKYPALLMGLCEDKKVDHYVTVLQEVSPR